MGIWLKFMVNGCDLACALLACALAVVLSYQIDQSGLTMWNGPFSKWSGLPTGASVEPRKRRLLNLPLRAERWPGLCT